MKEGMVGHFWEGWGGGWWRLVGVVFCCWVSIQDIKMWSLTFVFCCCASSLCLIQQIMYKNLVMRNGTDAHKKKIEDSSATKIPIPFIIISTDKDTIVQAEMNEDRSDIFFNFTQEFKIHDDEEVCRQLNVHKVSREQLPHMISKELIKFLPADYFGEEPLELNPTGSSSSSSS